jgi:uncharacterized protein (DUF3820 family)
VPDNLSDLERTVLPFGKHKGKTFDQAPLMYLDWLMGWDGIDSFPHLKRKLAAYLTHPTIKYELDRELEED